MFLAALLMIAKLEDLKRELVIKTVKHLHHRIQLCNDKKGFIFATTRRIVQEIVWSKKS